MLLPLFRKVEISFDPVTPRATNGITTLARLISRAIIRCFTCCLKEASLVSCSQEKRQLDMAIVPRNFLRMKEK